MHGRSSGRCDGSTVFWKRREKNEDLYKFLPNNYYFSCQIVPHHLTNQFAAKWCVFLRHPPNVHVQLQPILTTQHWTLKSITGLQASSILLSRYTISKTQELIVLRFRISSSHSKYNVNISNNKTYTIWGWLSNWSSPCLRQIIHILKKNQLIVH